MFDEFWAISVYFNPAGYRASLDNYFTFAQRLKAQKVNLLTVELAFNSGQYYIPQTENVLRLRSNSIMWQKERLINYAISQLPPSCKYFGWIDSDLLFPDGWVEKAIEKLRTNDIVQLYKRVNHLLPEERQFGGKFNYALQGTIWQEKIHKNWLEKRRAFQLPFASPGFAWAANRTIFDGIGIYDRNIIGSGDTFLVDTLLNSWFMHTYWTKITPAMKVDMRPYTDELTRRQPKVDYVPVDIYHLFHGNLRNRLYNDRHDIIVKYDFDPKTDIKLVNNVFEWNSPKKDMHDDIKSYFFARKEDEN